MHDQAQATKTKCPSGVDWCRTHPEDLLLAVHAGYPFVAVHPTHGIVLSAADEEEFDAELADRRPSVLSQLFLTCASLWVTLVDGTH